MTAILCIQWFDTQVLILIFLFYFTISLVICINYVFIVLG